MPCYRPITAYRSKSGRSKETGKWPIVFSNKEGYYDLTIQIPCRLCIGCKQESSRQWAIRCVHEASMYPEENNHFVTLTYNDENLPPNGTLIKRDMVLFLKKLRHKFKTEIRFFQCGEYGEKNKRAHHHILLFNCPLEDLTLWEINKKTQTKYYRSKIIEQCWTNKAKQPLGYSDVGAVTFESAAYVARYITKKITGDIAQKHYEHINKNTGEIHNRLPEFTTQSMNPGIGKPFYDKYKHDIYPLDKIVLKNMTLRPPKYYDTQYEKEHPKEMALLKAKRRKEAMLSTDNDAYRLRVKEAIKNKQFNLLVRPIERE